MEHQQNPQAIKAIGDKIDKYDVENFRKMYGDYIGKTLKNDGKDYQAIEHGGVKAYLKTLRTTPNKLGNIQDPVQNKGALKLTAERKTAFRNLLKVDNEAYIELKNNVVIWSNRVRTQFGLLWVRKLDNKGISLEGAEFELFGTNNESFGEGQYTGIGDVYFIVPVGNDYKYDGNQDRSQINSWLDSQFIKEKTKYKLKETKAPEGLRKLTHHVK